MKKLLHYGFKTLKILLITLVSLYLIAYVYITINKKKIIRQVTEQISKKINGNVKISDADISLFRSFPKISVLVNDVSVTDTMFAVHKHPFFTAKEIFVSINILKLIKKESPLTGIRLQNGSIYMYTDTAGYTNTYILKGKKDSAGGPKKTSEDINLKSVTLDRVRIILDDKKREKLHDFMVNELQVDLADGDKTLVISNDADILINSLAFNLPKGTFLKNATFAGSFELKYGKQSQQLSFDSIDIKLSGQKFNMSGMFDLGEKNPVFKFRVHVTDANYEAVKKLLPKRIDNSLSMVKLDKPLDADAQLEGPLQGGEPYVFVKWKVKNSKLLTPFLDFENASFTGFFRNEVTPGLPRNDPNSMISISDFTANWQTIPVNSGNIEIMNLSVPVLSCDLRSAFPLGSLNKVLQTNSLKFKEGDAALQLSYKGPLQRNSNTNSFLNGNIQFKNGLIHYPARNVDLKEVNGSMIFENSNINVQNLSCNLLNNRIVMNGSAKNLLTLINTAPNKVTIDWSVYSPSLNLGAFIYLLKDRTKTAKASSGSTQQLGKTSARIDEVLEQSRIDLSIKAGSVVYKKFTATNFDGNITMLQDRYLINNVSMNTAGGRMGINGQLVSERSNFHRATINTNMENVDVKKIFYAFNNFGQDGITSESLEGNLSSKINASMVVDDGGNVVPASVVGTIDFSLKNGALNNYEPVKKIQRFIFKKRDFENIRFAELKDRLEVNGGAVKMNRMEIQSSVISLYIEGTYKPKSGSDISIQVPLNNLRKREEDYNPVNIGTDKKGGRSIFLRGQTGSDGNVNFKLDLFNKFQKEKEKDAKK